MNPDSTDNASWGFLSTDGHFQPLAALSAAGLEYVSKSIAELQELMARHILTEEYEKCAQIRDEIAKRSHS